MKNRAKTALITGGARIGAHLAQELAKYGIRIALVYRHSKDKAVKTEKAIRNAGGQAAIFKADLSEPRQAENCISLVLKRFSRLDFVLNLASDYEQTPFKGLSVKKYFQLLDSNLSSTFHICRAAAPHLKKHRGRIVNFSDWVSASGRPLYRGFVPYYTAKAGVIGLTQALALELAPDVLVNCIAPGPILPPAKLKNDEVRNIKKVTPLKKWGGPDEILKAVRFLLETGFVTGECIRVDGGRHLE